MLGPVSGVASAARRRSRRRRRIIVVGLALVVFVLGEIFHQFLNASAPSARRAAGTWVASIAPVVTSANLLSQTLSYVESSGTKMSRPQLTLVLGSLVEDSAGEVRSVRTSTLGPPSRRAQQLLIESLDLRAQAFSSFDLAVNEAISGVSAARVKGDFVPVASAMTDAQDTYRSFLHILPAGSDPSQLPDVAWTAPKSLFTTLTFNRLATRLSLASQLRARHAVVITAISLSPLPEVIPTTTTTTTTTTIPRRSRVTTTTVRSRKTSTKRVTPSTTTTTLPRVSQIPTGSAPSIFAPTSSVRAIVVIRNVGNVPEAGIVVEALLNGSLVRSAPLVVIAPAGSRYLELAALRVVPASMARCASTSLVHDRCTKMEVRVSGPSGIAVSRSVALAFFVG